MNLTEPGSNEPGFHFTQKNCLANWRIAGTAQNLYTVGEIIISIFD
jgi:hypothetical protein